MGHAADREPEHDEVEPIAPAPVTEHLGRDPSGIAGRVPRLVDRGIDVRDGDLPPGAEQTAGIARPDIGIASRSPLTEPRPQVSLGSRPGRHLGLDVDLDLVHPVALGPHGLDPVKELDLHPPLDQQLVQRREYDVAHSGVHLPHQRAAIGEERPQQAAQRRARLGLRALRVAVAIPERQVVDHRAHQRALHRVPPRTVAEQPVAEIDAVDDVEAAGADHSVLDQAADDGDHQIDDVPGATDAVIATDRAVKAPAQEVHRDLKRAARRGRGARGRTGPRAPPRRAHRTSDRPLGGSPGCRRGAPA